MSEEPLWRPSPERIARTELSRFMADLRAAGTVDAGAYGALHRFSCERMAEFWDALWSFADVVGERRGSPVLVHPERMPGARFFPEARLSFAENLLRHRGDADAIVYRAEDGARRAWSRDELRHKVAALQAALRELGVGEGDRVAAFMPNVPETVLAMLATASLGAIFTSCSPDFGAAGVLDRFGQVSPRVLFCADGYTYKGRSHDSLARVAEFLPELPSVESVIVAGHLEARADPGPLDGGLSLDELLEAHAGAELALPRFPFEQPLYVLYSSGTTGKPKCMVHGAGGTLLKHLSEHRLMCDVRAADRVFYFTTCGWMMWNWLVTALASGATVLLYDGNPFHPGPEVLWEYAEAEGMTLFGTSAKYIEALRNAGARPGRDHDLSSLRTVTSTGSPLAPVGFDYVYEAVGDDLCLSSISGGTDIVGCFVGGNPAGPVWRGEIQAPVLGMDVDVFDPEGRPIRGDKGELVCKRPFPSMPLRFWDDPGDSRYRAAYFERYPGVWHHGDFAEITRHGGFVIHGRSDATLNPGGVRIGTGEIYRQVEQVPEVEESIAIGQDWEEDVRVILFVKLRDGAELDDELRDRIRRRIREGASPRHVPARILEVADIPRTKSGKLVELAVRDVVHGRGVEQREALANPEALEEFRDRPELRT